VFKISSNDVVIGYIADDRMVYVYSAFIDGTMTDIALINCLKYVNMGKQYVFKTKRACSKIKILNRYHLDSDYRKVLLHDKHRTINEVQYVVEEMIKKYRRTGKYIDELLEVYK
jgi:peptidoglycan/xylan/chitin deacetylase (PgdA/CDA1 family)